MGASSITSIFTQTVAKLVIIDKRNMGTATTNMATAMKTMKASLSSTGAITKTNTDGSKSLEFDAHFNPNQLQFLVSVEEEKKADLATKTKEEQKAENQSPAIPQITMTTTLTFDHVINTNAFISECNPLSASVNTVVGLAASTAKKTVRDEVQALLAAMYYPTTRNVVFAWGKFFFMGFLSYANAQYTMFNANGDPIRAEVVIRIVDEGYGEVMLKQWQEQYDATFGSTNLLANGTDVVSSLFNVSL